MNWFMRLLPQWHVTERNLMREVQKILHTTIPYSYSGIESELTVLCEKFGIEHGSLFIVWASIPQIKLRHQREAGKIQVSIRITTFRGRFGRNDIINFKAGHRWFACVRKPLVLASRLTYVPNIAAYVPAAWKRECLLDTEPDGYSTTVENVM